MFQTESTGGRIKLARSMLGLSRKDLEDLFHISSNTLQAWESDRVSLTDKGAKKLNEAFIKSGLLCTETWLLSGTGVEPIILKNTNALPNEINEEMCILREIEAFKAINPSPIIVIVNDDGMEPFYYLGDIVGGNKIDLSNYDQLVGRNCIIETYQGDTLIRRLLKGGKDGLYNLACINLSTYQQPIIQDIKPRFIAKIVMHRTRESQ